LGIPVIIVVPNSEHKKAEKILENVINDVLLIDPEDLLDKTLEILEG
jgi:HJR/Mrr/RecB family endonuclease